MKKMIMKIIMIVNNMIMIINVMIIMSKWKMINNDNDNDNNVMKILMMIMKY